MQFYILIVGNILVKLWKIAMKVYPWVRPKISYVTWNKIQSEWRDNSKCRGNKNELILWLIMFTIQGILI